MAPLNVKASTLAWTWRDVKIYSLPESISAWNLEGSERLQEMALPLIGDAVTGCRLSLPTAGCLANSWLRARCRSRTLSAAPASMSDAQMITWATRSQLHRTACTRQGPRAPSGNDHRRSAVCRGRSPILARSEVTRIFSTAPESPSGAQIITCNTQA